MRNKKLLIGAGAVVVAAAVAGFAGWYFILRSDAPPPVDIESAVAAAASVPEAAETTAAVALEDVNGTWTIEAGSDSFVGYRVREELATVGFTEAVARTSAVDASMSIDGTNVNDVAIAADMTRLQSDSSRRDRALQSQSIETDEFPTATFLLTSPIQLGSVPEDGVPFQATATGDLTIHGVTRAVDVPIEAQLTGSTIVIIASIPVQFSDYGIASPRSLALLSVEDNGVIEMQLLFSRG